MNKVFFICAVAYLHICASSFAQSFEKSFYSAYYDYGTDAITTANGDIILAGSSSANGTGLQDFVVARFNSNGNLLWQRVFGGGANELMAKLCPSADSNYVLIGKSTSFGNASGGIFVYKFDNNGDKIWSRFFESTDPTTSTYLEPTSIVPVVDGGFLISGYHSGTQTALLMRIDSLGNFNFGRTYNSNQYGGTGNDRANKVIIASDQNYVITGSAWGPELADILLAKFNQQGDTLWIERFGGYQWDVGNDVIETQDFGFLIVGYTYSFGAGLKDAIIVKTDFQGNLQWSKTFGGAYDDEALSVVELPSGNLMIVGYTTSFGTSGGNEKLLLKLDKNGNYMFSEILDAGVGMQGGVANSIRYYNNQLVIAGTRGGAFSDMYLAISDTNLSTLCSVTPIADTPNVNSLTAFNFPFITGLIFSNYTPLDQEYSLTLADSSLCTTTGINTISNYEKFKVYPNPGAGFFTIEQTEIQKTPYEIEDITGKVIQQGTLTEKRTTLDLSKNASGVYLLKIDTKTVQLIKQ